MTWLRTHIFIAGISLIMAVNTIVLLGVAYNRSGEPESSLQLSQRELRLPYRWNEGTEDSRLQLELQWRVLTAEDDSNNWLWGSYGTPEWLDEEKMTSLGFSPSTDSRTNETTSSDGNILPRDVFLVLELNGPAYQAALTRVTKYAQSMHEDEDALKHLKAEHSERSRLFVVDAGLDSAALRARHPDRDHYAIVRGQIGRRSNGAADRTGHVSKVNNTSINIPLQWRSVFGPITPEPTHSTDAPDTFKVHLDFGKRLEPWVAHAQRLQP